VLKGLPQPSWAHLYSPLTELRTELAAELLRECDRLREGDLLPRRDRSGDFGLDVAGAPRKPYPTGLESSDLIHWPNGLSNPSECGASSGAVS